MLHPERIMTALAAKRNSFTESEEERLENLDRFNNALDDLASLSLAEVEARLAGIEWPGVRPTSEHELYDDIIIPFSQSWSNHRQARNWAMTKLTGISTFAVDGSQISPSKDISIPVGVVQVGWFENLHQPEGGYVKDLAVEILASDEFADENYQETGFADWQVNLRRFQMELSSLTTYMEANAKTEPKPLCFYDGSLIISFAQHMRPDRQQMYVDAVIDLLQVSERTGVRLVGYVDTSYANDLTAMLGHLAGLHEGSRVSDAGLLRPLMQWGDRSQVYICARDDLVLNKYYEQICVVYLKTTQNNPPVRVELPRWLYESGQHEEILDLVRAECVVGNGYPYAVETADAMAVLTMQDRERFYALFQKFAEQEQLPLRFSRKALSKRGRRI